VNFLDLRLEGLGSIQWGAADVRDLAGSNHINGRGTMTLPLTVVFNDPATFGIISLVSTLVADCTDDKGNHIVVSRPLLLSCSNCS
jgi:hypothetical protein